MSNRLIRKAFVLFYAYLQTFSKLSSITSLSFVVTSISVKTGSVFQSGTKIRPFTLHRDMTTATDAFSTPHGLQDMWLFGYGYCSTIPTWISFYSFPRTSKTVSLTYANRSLIWKPPPHFGKSVRGFKLNWHLKIDGLTGAFCSSILQTSGFPATSKATCDDSGR